MTRPGGRPGRAGRSAPRIRPSQILATAVVLAAFVAGLVIAGPLGAAIVALLSAGAAVLLARRWHTLDPRIRVVRALIVLIGLAVAVSLLYR